MRNLPIVPSIVRFCVVTTTVINPFQSVQAQQLIEIVGVEVRETDNGIEIILETSSGVAPEFVETPDGTTLYVDLIDSQLRLPEGDDYQIENPATGIESVTVVEEFEGTVSLVVTGTETLPNIELTPSPQGAVVSVVTPSDTAQTPPPTTPTPPPPEDEIEIVVTGEAEEEDDYVSEEVTIGRGNPQSILDISQSVQTVTEEVIEDRNVRDLNEVTDFVSGLNRGTVGTDRAGSAFVIRGFSAVAGRENILRNGLRDDTIRFISGVTNIERVEVLKGPASVLFGQGTVGGTINLVTKKPLDEPFYELEVSAGNYDSYSGRIDFSAPLDEEGGLAYRLNANYEDEASFKDFQEKEFYFVDLTAALVQTEATELYFGVEYQKETTEGAAPELPASGTVIDNPLGEVDIDENLGEPSIAEDESSVARLSSELIHEFSDNWRIQGQFLASLQEIPESLGFVGTDLRNNRTFIRLLNENETDNDVYTINTNVVGEFNTGSIEHELLLGVEYASQKLQDRIDFALAATIDIFDPVYQPDQISPSFPFANSETTFNEVGLYIQDQINLTDNLIVTLGGRYNIADSEFVDEIAPELSSDRTDTDFSPRAGIIFKPAENVSLYASYVESFLPNIGRSRAADLETGQTVLGEEFVPETGRQFEVGVKAEFGDVIATLALYDLKRSNVLDLQTLSSSQIGEQKSQGIELDVAGEILPGWKIITSYSYTDTEVLENERSTVVDGEVRSLVGNQLQNVPEHSFSIWTTYDIQQGSLEGLGFGLGFVYEGEKQGDLENTFTIPDYFRTDAALFYETGNFRAQLNIENLFDIRYFESARDEFRVNPGAPFTISGSISLEF